MSIGVSQLKFWKEGLSPDELNSTNSNSGKGGGAQLSYDIFLGLSFLGGFFALDHFYLRSPLTAIAKIIVNILVFGIWWLYDASQAIYHMDVVKVYGLGIPGIGPMGIAGGVLSHEQPDKKHLSFVIYTVILFMFGAFGGDSFLLGDKRSGYLRLFSLITVIFAPVALCWWGYHIYRYFFKTKDMITNHSDYFGAIGAPKPEPEEDSSFFSIFYKIPIIGPFLKTFVAMFTVSDIVKGVMKGATESVKVVMEGATESVKGVTDTAQIALKTVDDTILLGKTVVEQGSEVAKKATESIIQVTDTVQEVGKQIASVSGAIPSMYDSDAAKVTAAMQGGAVAGLNLLPYTLLGTLLVIAVASFILTYYRSKKNVPRDDAPPEPGVFRKFDSEKHSA